MAMRPGISDVGEIIMRKSKMRRWAWTCVVLAVFAYPLNVTSVLAADEKDLLRIVNQLNKQDKKEWRRAVDYLTSWAPGEKRKVKSEYAGDDRIKTALINRFAEESKGKIVGEGNAEAVSLLASLVASLKDSRAVPILLDNINNREVEEYLAETKDKRILQRMLKNAQASGFPGKRTGALRVMSRMHEADNADKAGKEKIQEAIKSALHDNHSGVRIWAVRSAAKVGDDSTRAALRAISKDDAYKREIDASVRGGKKGEKLRVYPIREEAKKALEELERRRTLERKK